MNVASESVGYALLAVFAVFMVGLTVTLSGRGQSQEGREGFLYAGRSIGTLAASFSIAASWIWAPALFVSVQVSYEMGLTGLFWFTVPNILAVMLYSVIGPRLRSRVPGGFSVPDWIRYRFSNENHLEAKLAHRLYLIPYIWYQIMAVTVQIFVGGMILNFLTGIPLEIAMAALLGVGLSYSLISGLRASVVTDFFQMGFILGGLLVVVPMLLSVVGWEGVSAGFEGTNQVASILDPGVAFSFGIVTSIGLFAGAISDQQFWQRVFSIKRDRLRPAFVYAGLLFGAVPLLISSLGFVAAAPNSGITLPEGTGLPMIGIATVLELLPFWIGILFVFLLLAGLSSTLDSGLTAAASLFIVDIRGVRIESELADRFRRGEDLSEDEMSRATGDGKKTVAYARASMIVFAAIGYAFALFVKDVFPLDRLWWLFNGVATMFVVPTILSIYWDKLSARGVVFSIVGSIIAFGGFVYGNYIQDNAIVVSSAVAIILVSTLCCVVFRHSTSTGERPKGFA